MKIDNFQLVRNSILNFENKGDFFFILILKRRKDTKGAMVEGVNEDNRLIKHYFVYSKDYFDKKAEAIRNLCDQNDARAYILPQRRNEVTVLCSLLVKIADIVVERLKNTVLGLFKARKENKNLRENLRLAIQGRLSEKEKTDLLMRLDAHDAMDRKAEDGDNQCGLHFDHLIRSCVAGCHQSDRSRWVIDIDRDAPEFKGYTDEQFNGYVYDVIDLITEIRRVYKQTLPYDTVVVPTPHGVHIVTEPFNKQELVAQKRVKNTLPFWDNNRIQADAMTMIYSNLTERD